MLDTLADKEPKLSPKATAQAGGTDGPALHPTRDDLKGYAYGRLASARLDYCQAHLDTCEDCRIELEDIRTCSNEMSSMARPEVPSARSLRRKRNPALPLAASAAVLVAVAVSTALWVKHSGTAAGSKAAQGATASAADGHAVTAPAAAPTPVAQGAIAQRAIVAPPVTRSADAQGTAAPSRVAQNQAAVASVARGTVAPDAAAATRGAAAQVAAIAPPGVQGTGAQSQVVQAAEAPLQTTPGLFARIGSALSRVVHGSPNAAQTQVAQAPAASVAAAPAIGAPPSAPQLSDEIAALPADVRSAVSATIQHGKLEFPTNVGRSRRHTSSHGAAPVANTSFALLGPFGEATSDTRPEFSWQPLPGATHYSVAIVDSALHPVQHSGAVKKTVWRPKHPLHPGRTYLWQVTAILPGGSRVVASEPAPSEAVLRIVPVKLSDEMARFRKDHQDSHLVLGALYAQAGMLSESEDELKKVPPSDSSYKTARTLLENLSSTGPSAQ